ncbi:MAG: TetR/AcrR family transcriptional regulator, partial [Mesorhizobium sp.]|nr:TetR/AcrR family transcriptional regulator [Mesorhizobium sp.]
NCDGEETALARNTEERRVKLRVALIAAAERRIAANGYAALTARELARETGCALGTIYTIFTDMDALVAEVNSRTVAKLEAAVASAFATMQAGFDAKGALVLLGQTYFEFVLANPKLWSAIFEVGFGSAKELPQWRIEEHVRPIGHIVKPLRFLFPDESEERRVLLAKSLFSAVHGIVSLGLQRRFVAVPPEQISEQIRFIVEAFCDGIAARASPKRG